MPPLKEDVRQQLDEAGIPVLQYWALHVDRILPMIDDFGAILGKEERAKELHDFIEGYYNLAMDRLKDLPEESRPRVYYMIMGQTSWTCGEGSDMGKSIEEAGGRNIAAGLFGSVPEVDPEWIIEQNPDVMVYHHIRQSESNASVSPSLDDLKERRDFVISQPGFPWKTKKNQMQEASYPPPSDDLFWSGLFTEISSSARKRAFFRLLSLIP